MGDLGRMGLGRRYAAWFSGWLLVCTLGTWQASPVAADDAGWAAAAEPGAILLMRHALAPGTGDPAAFDLDDCSTQRNLDDAGRAQAQRIGEAFVSRGLVADRVLTSQWCRCRETAELLDLGVVEDLPALNSFFQNRATAGTQTQDVLAFLEELPEDQRVLLVSHQVNITALAGVYPKSGEVIVVDLSPEGDLTVEGRILIDP